MGIQGSKLVYSYQLRREANIQKPWGDEAAEADVTPGQRCRIWIGLDPTSSEIAEHLLEKGNLGVLTLPITTPNGAVELKIRPRNRAVKSPTQPS